MIVPDKFNMVDMEGIDLLEVQGVPIDGLYTKLVESIALCRYQCLYNWKFDGILIPPTYVEMEVGENEEVLVNFGITVTPDDVIHLQTIEPGPSEPVIISLFAEENMVYNAPVGVDGFNPVTVDVPSYSPVLTTLTVDENGTYSPPTGVDGYDEVVVNVSPTIQAVPFIENQGSFYFDTGVAGNTIYKIIFEFMPVSVITNYQWYAGAYNNNFTLASMQVANGVTSGFIRVANVDFGVISLLEAEKNILVCESGEVYLNGDKIAGSYSGPINSNNTTLKLLGGSANSHSRIFSCKLYDQNGVLIRDYVPHLDSNNIACLLDNVNNTILYATTQDRPTFGYAIDGGF